MLFSRHHGAVIMEQCTIPKMDEHKHSMVIYFRNRGVTQRTSRARAPNMALVIDFELENYNINEV